LGMYVPSISQQELLLHNKFIFYTLYQKQTKTLDLWSCCSTCFSLS